MAKNINSKYITKGIIFSLIGAIIFSGFSLLISTLFSFMERLVWVIIVFHGAWVWLIGVSILYFMISGFFIGWLFFNIHASKGYKELTYFFISSVISFVLWILLFVVASGLLGIP